MSRRNRFLERTMSIDPVAVSDRAEVAVTPSNVTPIRRDTRMCRVIGTAIWNGGVLHPLGTEAAFPSADVEAHPDVFEPLDGDD